MTCRLFNLLTVLSLMLCVAVVAFWVRSYTDEVRMDWGGSIQGHFGWQGYDKSVVASRGGLLYIQSSALDGSDAQQETGRWGMFGFLCARGKGGVVVVPAVTVEAYHVAVGVPFWAVTGVAAVTPLAWFRRQRQLSLRRQRGLCPQCGYDLRATPGGARCREASHRRRNTAAA